MFPKKPHFNSLLYTHFWKTDIITPANTYKIFNKDLQIFWGMMIVDILHLALDQK